jgi:O-antigen ligase
MRSESITSIRKISAEVHEVSWGRLSTLTVSGFLLVFAPLAYGAVHTWAYSAVGLTIGMMSIAVLSFGLFNLMAKPDEKYFVPRPPLWWLACGLALIVFVQVMPWPAEMTKWLSPEAWKVRTLGNGLGLADYLPLSLNPYKSLLEGLKLWPAVTLFFILIYTLNSRRQMRTMMGIIIGVAFLETLYGFVEFRSHLIWGWKNPYAGSRLCGTLINSNNLATFLTMAVLLGFGLFLSSKPNQVQDPQGPGVWTNLRRQSRSEHLEPLFRRFLLLFVLLLITVGLIFTGSRSGMTALVVGFAIMGMLIWGQRWRRGNLVVIAVFLAAAVIYSLVLGSAQFLTRFQDLGDSGRYYAYSAALQIFRQFPLLGSGLSTFGDVFYQYEPASLNSAYFIPAHSDWLQLLAESGALGFALALIAFLAFYFRLMQQWRQRQDRFARGLGLGGLAAMGAAVFQALGEFPFHVPAISLTFAAIAAITYVALHSRQQGREHFSYPFIKLSGRRRIIPGVLAGLIILQLFIIIMLGQVWLAERAAPTEIDSTRPPQQLTGKDFQKALAHNPRNSRYYLGLAESSEQEKEPPAGMSLSSLKTAIFYAPADWGYRLKMAEFCLRQCQKDPARYLPMALKEFGAAVKLFPDSPLLQYRLGSVLIWAESYYPGLIPPELRGQGKLHLARAIELDPRLKE